jgi:hypothetical protein
MAGSVTVIATAAIAANRNLKEFIPSPSTCFPERIYAQGEYYLQLVVPRTPARILGKDSLHFQEVSIWVEVGTQSAKATS